MTIVYCPPALQKLPIDAAMCCCGLSCFLPRLFLADEVDQTDIVPEMPKGRLVLIAAAGGTVVCEAKAVPLPGAVVLIQEALIGTIEAATTRCDCLQGVEFG